MEPSRDVHDPNLLQSVIATEELYQRIPREIRLQEESASFQELAETIAAEPEMCLDKLKHMMGGTTPRNFSPCGVCLDKLVQITLQLCEADTVGISVEETTEIPWRTTVLSDRRTATQQPSSRSAGS